MWTIPDELLAENGGNFVKVENSDGSISYKPIKVKYGVGNYTGSEIPPMGRRNDRAGKTVEEDGFLLTYDDFGYCVELKRSDWITPKDDEDEEA